MKKKIAIIGSGIAGLTLANFLYKDKNHDFMVYEKNESLPLDEGYGIQLSTNSIKILNEINFTKINNEKLYHPKGVDIYSIQNKKLCDLDLMQFNTNDNKYTTLQRSTLIEFLKDDIYTQHIRFGKRIKEVSELKGKVLIKFDDNTNDLVNYVVGADGIFSNTRTFFEKKKNKPVFKNAIAIRTILKSKSGLEIDQSKVSLMMGKNCHLVIYPINKKKELNFVCVLRHRKKDPDIKILLNKLVEQNPNLGKAFEEDLKSWPLYATPRILPSTNSKVLYIGDAFNGFLPTLAQGAGQSIESAYELFNLIKNERGDIQNIYFQERSKRAKMVRRRSNFNFFIFHLSSKFMQMIRNFFMKSLVKRRGFINSYLGSVYKN
ncbi:FAD-dependent monooxygenase [Pelagibacteraceae bacterium]|nr:FAD-dependent monooxygenase [Pelagibacteraceae bacterium]